MSFTLTNKYNISPYYTAFSNVDNFAFDVALMPEGDHMNIIDPPGLTVMRIAGGRYRVTGAVSDILT